MIDIDQRIQGFTPNPNHTANLTRGERRAFWMYVWAMGIGFNFWWIIAACHDASSPQPFWSGMSLALTAIFQGGWTLNCWFWFKMGQWKRDGNIWYYRGWAIVMAITIFLILRQIAERNQFQHFDGGPTGYDQYGQDQYHIAPNGYDQRGNPIQHGHPW